MFRWIIYALLPVILLCAGLVGAVMAAPLGGPAVLFYASNLPPERVCAANYDSVYYLVDLRTQYICKLNINNTNQNVTNWSPDGRYIAAIAPDTNDELSIQLLDTRTNQHRDIQVGPNPLREFNTVWSPDGRYIAFVGIGGDVALYVVDLELEEAVFVSEEEPFFTPSNLPAWSPDSRYVAFVAQDTSVCVLDLDIWETHCPGYGLQPHWWPTGDQLAMTDVRGGIFTLDVQTGQRRQLFIDGRAPRWSPDGRYIAFLTRDSVFGSFRTEQELRLMDAETGQQRILLEDITGVDHLPEWAPGTNLLYTVSQDQRELLLIDTDGNTLRRVKFGSTIAYPQAQP